MKVRHLLSSMRAAVGNKTVPLRRCADSAGRSLGYQAVKRTYFVVACALVEVLLITVVAFGNHQYMDWGFWRNVMKGNRVLILADFFARELTADNFCKNVFWVVGAFLGKICHFGHQNS